MARIELHAVLPEGSWRSAAAYADLGGIGARGLAWELLRRDPGYRDAVAAEGVGKISSSGALIASSAHFSARWGLHFR